MLYINMDATVKEFDASMYMNDLAKVMRAEFVQAAKAFFMAAVQRVHVDTGMSLGSFIKFARNIKQELDQSRRWVYSPTKRYNAPGGRSMKKLPSSGDSLSEYKLSVTGTGTKNPKVHFHFATGVWHYIIWDELGFGGKPPWQSFKAGRDAMMAALKDLSTKVPPIKNYMIATRIRANSIGGTVTTKIDERRQWTSRNP